MKRLSFATALPYLLLIASNAGLYGQDKYDTNNPFNNPFGQTNIQPSYYYGYYEDWIPCDLNCDTPASTKIESMTGRVYKFRDHFEFHELIPNSKNLYQLKGVFEKPEPPRTQRSGHLLLQEQNFIRNIDFPITIPPPEKIRLVAIKITKDTLWVRIREDTLRIKKTK